jgi:ABC-type multidrug transport system fused ATPase/permease subunit
MLRYCVRVAYTFQSPVLFNETIMYNVRYAKLDATDEGGFPE